MHNFTYSLIRYTPSLHRGEMVNIGLIVFNDKLDIRLLKSANKIRMLDNETSVADLRKLESNLVNLGELSDSFSYESFSSLITCFGNSVLISSPATFNISNLGQYDAKVQHLFDTLVKPFASREPTPRNSRLVTSLKRKFASIDILANNPSELDEHKVVSNYVLNQSTGISVDFMLKNGKYHLTEVIDYDVVDKKGKYKETTMKLMTFVEGQKSLDGETASYFVYSASSKTESEVTQQINLAESYSTNIFNIASKQDEAEYFQIIQNAIGRELPLMH